ncbi:MAG: hypothetical protein AABZ74_04980 [Cyanobacteriota bacterium]
MKKILLLTIASMIFTSCASPQGTNLQNSVPTISKVALNENSSTFEKTEVSGIKFKKADPNKPLDGSTTASGGANETSTVNTNVGVATPSAAAAPALDSASGASKSSLAIGRPIIGGGSYFPSGNSFEEYVMIDYEEGVTNGFSGSSSDAYNKIVKPVLKEWASDSRMVNTSGTTDDKGNNKNQNPPQNGYYDQFKWNFTFASSSKKEIYSFFISEKETYVSRQKWGLKDLSPENITIDSAKAIQIYKEKVADKTFQPDNQNYYKSQNSELLYSIPSNGTWNFYLQQDKDGLVWSVNVYFPVDYQKQEVKPTEISQDPAKPIFTKPVPTVSYSYSGGYARIDAKTGKVLSMNRIIKYTQQNYPYPCPNGFCGDVPVPLAVQ